MKVAILGAGKVGRALARALRARGEPVRLVAARTAGRARFRELLLVVAVKDSEITRLARALSHGDRVGRRTAVIHLAGAYGPELLEPLRACSAGVGQAHPMISFASRSFSPDLAGAHLLVDGDRVAVERASRLGRTLGMVPRRWKHVDRALYHAAGGLVANGSAALAAAGARLLELAGAPPRDAAKVLAPLLRSVATNVEKLGLPAALTGPVRRGDSATVAAHRAKIAESAPDLAALYDALGRLQHEIARALGAAPPREFYRLAAQLGARPRRRR